MTLAVLLGLGRDSWVRFNLRSYDVLPTRTADPTVGGELHLTHHISPGASPFAQDPRDRRRFSASLGGSPRRFSFQMGRRCSRSVLFAVWVQPLSQDTTYSYCSRNTPTRQDVHGTRNLRHRRRPHASHRRLDRAQTGGPTRRRFGSTVPCSHRLGLTPTSVPGHPRPCTYPRPPPCSRPNPRHCPRFRPIQMFVPLYLSCVAPCL